MKPGRKKKASIVEEVKASPMLEAFSAFDSEGGKFLSPNDIGRILNVTGEAVKQWIYRRKLPAVKLANGYWKIAKTDFEGFLKARTEIGKRHVLATGKEISSAVIAACEALSLQLVVAHNYPDALLKAFDHLPCLFIIDIQSAASAFEFAKKLRSNKKLRSFPILLLGGSSISDADAEQAVELEAQGIISAPLGADQLKAEIDRILRRTM